MAQIGSGRVDLDPCFPAVVDTAQTWQNATPLAQDDDTRLDAELANDVVRTLVNIETTLGANPQGPFGSVGARLTAIEGSLPMVGALLLNVHDYGALGDGVADDAPAIAAAVLDIEAAGRGTLYFPPGAYRMESRVTITNCHCAIQGAGIEVTQICVANSVGAFNYVCTDVGLTDGNAKHWTVQDLTILAEDPTPLTGVSRGTALHGSWTVPNFFPETRACLIARVNIRSRHYVADPDDAAYWTKGIHLENASHLLIADCSVLQVSNQTGEMIHLDNVAASGTSGAFPYTLRGIVINGGETALALTGWMENVSVVQFEFVGAHTGIAATGEEPGGNWQPFLVLADGHINALIHCVRTVQWAYINITNCLCFTYPSGFVAPAATGGVLSCTNGVEVAIHGCQFSTGQDLATATVGIRLDAIQYYVISGTQVSIHMPTGGTAIGIEVVGQSQYGMVTQNIVTGYLGQPTAGIRIASGTGGWAENLLIAQNWLGSWAIGIDLVSPVAIEVAGNRGTAVTTMLSLSGTVASGVVVRDNTPAPAALALTTTNTTPSIAGAADGLVTLAPSAPTSITTFQDGVDGRLIELLATNSNATLVHSAGLVLAGATNLTLAPQTLLTLRYRGTAWYEVSRALP